MNYALRKSPLVRALSHLTLVALAIPCILPLLWMVSTSLKTEDQIFPRRQESSNYAKVLNFIPSPARWQNYPEALRFVPFGTYLHNTLFLCGVNVFGSVLASACVAYGFACTQFRFRRVLFLLMLATMMLPPQVTMIPVFLLFKKLGWYNTYLPLTVPHFTGVPFYIFLMTQFFRRIPKELGEAARIDGCGEWRIFATVYLPLSIPVLATCALFQFIGTWNDFLGPLIYINNPAKYTVAYGLQQFLGAYGGKWAHLMAGATVFTIPIIVLFFIAQKTFIQGIATTGGK